MKAVEIHSIGLCGDKRKLLVIIRNYRAALKTKPTNKNPWHLMYRIRLQKNLKVSDIKFYRQTGHRYSNTAVVD